MKIGSGLFVATILFACATQNFQAQCDSTAQVISINDTLYATVDDSTLDSSIKIAPDELSAYYHFDFQQDSSRLFFNIGEFVRNSHYIYLDNWCFQKMYNFDDDSDSARWDYSNASLSSISRTKNITIVSGDTLSFYRELYWVDRTSGGILNPSKLVSDDDISYSVELVRVSDNTRLMMLDTMFVSATTGSKKPCLLGWRPVLSRVGVLVPNSVSSPTAAFLRVNVYSSGSSGSSFMRFDDLKYQHSKQSLESSGWQSYSSNVINQNDCSPTCYFSATGYSSPKRIVVDIDNGQSSVEVVDIHDIWGSLINSTSLPTSDPFTVNVTSTGIYVAVGKYNGVVVCSKTVIVP